MRVLLADDHALFRAGMASLLGAWGIEVVGQAGDGLEALEQTRRLCPDLVLMDITMPRCNGLEATRLIKAETPQVKIVMVTVSDDVADLFEAIKSGADGYLLKGMSHEDFSRTLTAIAAGEAVLSRRLAGKILEEFALVARDERAREPGESDLTEGEREVLQLVADGGTNQEIATSLHVSENTVSLRMKNTLAKLHQKNRPLTAAWAIRTGLVRVPEGWRR